VKSPARSFQQYARLLAAVGFVALAAGALAGITFATSTGSAASAASYYYNCPGGAAAVYYSYCPPTNTSPNYTPPPDQTSNEGENKVFSLGSFSDPDNGPWQVVVSWGDGGITTFTRNSAGALPPTAHTYVDNGTYTVTVTVTDSEGGSDAGSFHVTVANVPPTVGPLTCPVSPVPVGTVVIASAPFTDPGTVDTHTASFNWGDGTTSPGVVIEASGSGSARGTHAYTSPFVYTVTLTVTDKDGGSGQASCTVVVFDTGVFVTGGGWISPPSGRANFGFVAKYHDDDPLPSGNTLFQYKTGNLMFKSTSYDWLVIAGNRAILQGSGTVNGSGEYSFRLNVTDNSPDTFRITITNKTNGVVVYDNGADTPLSGGSITIHG
jgi:PKD repeat protein